MCITHLFHMHEEADLILVLDRSVTVCPDGPSVHSPHTISIPHSSLPSVYSINSILSPRRYHRLILRDNLAYYSAH